MSDTPNAVPEPTGRGYKRGNEYAAQLGSDLYKRTPKAVFAAVAVSMLTSGGDEPDQARARFLSEWQVLYENGIVPQRPPASPGEENW